MQGMTVKQAAEQLGMSEQAVRIRMRRGKLPIGTCDKLTGDRWVYCIWQEWVDQYAQHGPRWQERGVEPREEHTD